MFTNKRNTDPPEPIYFHEVHGPYGAFANDAPYALRLHDITYATVTHYLEANQARPKWDALRDDYLYRALYAKFTQHLDLEEMLLETEDAMLIFANPADRYYGVGVDGTGRNMLGRLLMSARRRIQFHHLRARGSNEEDIRRLEARVREQPRDSSRLAYLAELYFDEGWYEHSLRTARAIVALEPEDEYGYTVLALSLIELSRYEEAVEPLKLLTRMDPEYSRYFVWLSDTMERLGRIIPARIYARRARLIDEGND
jgi:predicted NAD-dependent protein-ADP-ribosyltransferase YbiA (DUF1768 family)